MDVNITMHVNDNIYYRSVPGIMCALTLTSHMGTYMYLGKNCYRSCYIDPLKCTYPGVGPRYTTLMTRGGTYLLGNGDAKVLLDARNQWLLTGRVQHPLLDGRLEARTRVNEH